MKLKKNLGLLATALAISASAQAAAQRPKATETPLVITRSAPESSSGKTEFGLGLTSWGMGGTTNALSFLMQFNATHSLQIHAALKSTDPFHFGAGAIYRAQAAGSETAGFHVGGGFSLGTGFLNAAVKAPFSVHIAALVGAHYLVNQRVLFTMEGGPQLYLVDGSASFTLATNPLFGLSVHYLF